MSKVAEALESARPWSCSHREHRTAFTRIALQLPRDFAAIEAEAKRAGRIEALKEVLRITDEERTCEEFAPDTPACIGARLGCAAISARIRQLLEAENGEG